MPDDPRVQRLIEELLDSGGTPEAVCLETPELLPRVREGWRRYRALEVRIAELFPEPGSVADRRATAPDDGLPSVPGYELTGVLGRGGVGVVYRAVHRGLNRTVALKMLLAGAFATRAERQRFAREAEVVAGLRHPNIVQVYDVGDLDGRPFFTMELLEGGTLAERIAGTPRPAREAAELAATLADAIAAAHRRGVVHRDLKPSNVLATAEGVPKIADFGLARDLEAGSSLTQTGAAVGTPSYMAPEQARGRTGEVGPASDQYALGAVLYELLTGRPPFRAESAAETLHQVLTQDPVPPSRLNPKSPRDLETICLKCLRKEPRLRYADAEALAQDLHRFLRGEAIAARPEDALQRLARRVRRRPGSSALAATGVLLAITLLGGAFWLASARAATARAAEADLREMVRSLQASSWPEARASLERLRGRLGEHGGSARLRGLLDQGARDLELVARLDAVLLSGHAHHDEGASSVRIQAKYEAAFLQGGLGYVRERPEVVAARVKASNVRQALVDALDTWAASTTQGPRRRDWLLAVARLADDDSNPWRVRARDPATWKDGVALARVVSTAPVEERCVPLMMALARQLQGKGRDVIPFLSRVQQAHPDDFWANFWLGEVLLDGPTPGESLRYFQAALAVRPGAAAAYFALGIAVAKAGRPEEAFEPLRRAARLDPTFGYGLATCLRTIRRHDEAIAACRLALGSDPGDGRIHQELGINWEASGRPAEAIAAYRRAVALDPTATPSQQMLRSCLMRQGRTDGARAAWREALAADPPGHDAWYGYAELCLFLRAEDEYRRARRDLLEKFGASTDPLVAERTARACLLLPASGDELPRAVALAERACAADRVKYRGTYPYFLFTLGLAEYRQGHFDRAIDLMQGDAARVLGPAPRLLLAMALHRVGRIADARETLAAALQAHDWRDSEVRDQDGWIFHVLRREAQGLILQDPPTRPESGRRSGDKG